jgi:hypothetical protein
MPSSGMLCCVALVRTDIVFLHSMYRFLVTAKVVLSSLILVTLMMEALLSSETSVLMRATWRNIPEDGVCHNISYLPSTTLYLFTFSIKR